MLLAAVCLLFAAAAPPRADPELARARAAFEALTPAARKDVVDLATLYVEQSGSFQAALIAWVKHQQDRDRSAWKVRENPAFYDPHTCAPKEPTPRRWLAPEDRAAVAARAALLGARGEGAHARGFVYDWASGEIVRVSSADETARAFENLLSGFAPDLDLVEALVERALDDRSLAREAAAFGHAYTDRAGNVYPGITLYDAHGSGAEFEMPDVDVLGLVGDLGITGPWEAPIPASEHAGLYAKIGAAFTPLHRHRGLRAALARAFAVGDAELGDGYAGLLDNFHALWEDCGSTPATLRARLPTPAERDRFLEEWTARCHGPESPFEAGRRRRATLVADARAVREATLAALRELGALPSGAKNTTGAR